MTKQTQFIETSLINKLHKVGTQIGKTPLFELTRTWDNPHVRIFAKHEWHQLGGSVKSRPAFQIIRQAILNGTLNANRPLLDATSGNTGIAYASICAALGIPVVLCLPENASTERREILQNLGVDIVFTSRFEGTDGAQEKAKAMVAAEPDRFFYADQYANDNNWKAHLGTTAREIWDQTGGKITHFVAGLGTTGTLIGTGRGLKSLSPDIQIIGLQPDNPMHGLEGWKHLETAIVPKIYDATVAHRVLEVDTLKAYDQVRHLARQEGWLVSPSAGANLQGAIQLAKEIDEGVIVTTFADNASKYTEVMRHIFA